MIRCGLAIPGHFNSFLHSHFQLLCILELLLYNTVLLGQSLLPMIHGNFKKFLIGGFSTIVGSSHSVIFKAFKYFFYTIAWSIWVISRAFFFYVMKTLTVQGICCRRFSLLFYMAVLWLSVCHFILQTLS